MPKIQAFLVVLMVALGAGLPTVVAVGEISFGIFGADLSIDDTKKSVVFVGDIMLARKVEYYMDLHGSMYPYTRLDPFRSDEFVVGNFESSMTEFHRPTPFYTFSFRTKPEHIDALKSVGFTHLSLANNHTFDSGSSGFTHTSQVLREKGLTIFGHPNTIASSSLTILNINNVQVSIIGIHAVGRAPNEKDLRALFDVANAESDHQIVYIHWGDEYVQFHSKFQEELASALVERGADLIIGHHPHVVQDVGLVGRVPVFYSLGNFVFDQYFSREVQEGLVLEVTPQSGELAVQLKPVVSTDMQSAPRPMNEDEARIFLSVLAARSDLALRNELQQGTIDTQFALAKDEKITSISQY